MGKIKSIPRKYDVFLLTSLIWFLAQFVRYLLPPLFGKFQALFGVSNTTLGVIFSSLILAYAAMQFPSGALADRFGTTRVIVAGVVLSSIGAFLIFAIPTIEVLALAAITIGLGTGAHKTVAITLLSGVYPKRTGELLGSMDAVGHLGGATAPSVIVAVLAVGLSWRYSFLLVAVIGIVLALAFHRRAERANRVVPEPDQRNPESSSEPLFEQLNDYLAPFGDARLSTFVLATTAYAISWNGLTAFLPLYLSNETGLNTRGVTLVYGSLFLVGLVQPISGAVADRVGYRRVLVLTLGLAAMCLFGLVATDIPVIVGLVVPLIGLGMHGFRPVRDAYLVNLVPPAVEGGTLGIARTIMVGTGALSPALVGFLSELIGFKYTFGILAIVTTMGVSLIGVPLLLERPSPS